MWPFSIEKWIEFLADKGTDIDFYYDDARFGECSVIIENELRYYSADFNYNQPANDQSFVGYYYEEAGDEN